MHRTISDLTDRHKCGHARIFVETLVLGLVLFISDIISDVYVSYVRIRDDHVFWGSWGLFFIFLPNIGLTVNFFMEHPAGKSYRIHDFTRAAFFQVYAVRSYVMVMLRIWKGAPDEAIEDALAEETDPRWVESILESTPQFLLQLMITFRLQTSPETSTWISLSLSMCSILYVAAKNQKRVARELPGLVATLRIIPIIFVVGLPRLFTWAVMSAYFKGFVFVVFVCSLLFNVAITRFRSIVTRVMKWEIRRLLSIFTSGNFYVYSGSFVPVLQLMCCNGNYVHGPFIWLSSIPIFLSLGVLWVLLYFKQLGHSPMNFPPMFSCFHNVSFTDAYPVPCDPADNFYLTFECFNGSSGTFPVRLCEGDEDTHDKMLFYIVPACVVAMLVTSPFWHLLDIDCSSPSQDVNGGASNGVKGEIGNGDCHGDASNGVKGEIGNGDCHGDASCRNVTPEEVPLKVMSSECAGTSQHADNGDVGTGEVSEKG